MDQLLPAKQNGLNLIDFFIFARQILSFRFSATENDDSKGVVKNMGGWDNLAKKSQCAALKVDATAQFELFRKQAKQKEDRVSGEHHQSTAFICHLISFHSHVLYFFGGISTSCDLRVMTSCKCFLSHYRLL